MERDDKGGRPPFEQEGLWQGPPSGPGDFGAPPPPPNAPKAKPQHTLSLVLAIIGMSFSLMPIYVLALPCSIIAVILSRDYSQSQSSQAKAAFIISVIALVIIAISLIIVISALTLL